MSLKNLTLFKKYKLRRDSDKASNNLTKSYIYNYDEINTPQNKLIDSDLSIKENNNGDKFKQPTHTH